MHSNLNFNAQRKPGFTTKLNLIALMDIFTILVFFLLLNSGDSEKLESAKFVKLPDSSAGTAPHNELTILINDEEIWVEKEAVLEIETLKKNPEKNIQPLADALAQYREKRGELNAFEKEQGLTVTILGDHSVSFSLLQHVMNVCQEQNFRNISLAVNRVVAPVFEFSGQMQALTEQSTSIDAQGG